MIKAFAINSNLKRTGVHLNNVLEMTVDDDKWITLRNIILLIESKRKKKNYLYKSQPSQTEAAQIVEERDHGNCKKLI